MAGEISSGRASAAELRSVCVELELALRAGAASGAEEILASHSEISGDPDAALEVIYTEFVTREQLGQRPAADDFLARFPQWRDGLLQLFEIHKAVGDGHFVIPSATPFPDAERWRKATETPGDARRIGNYEVRGEIGRGGMGVVYEARQLGLNRRVALKMILTGADAGPRERVRFRAEAEAAARLQHPNIVQIHEVGEHEGRPFLSLEYVDGPSLEDRLDGKPWPAIESARLVETLARAMHYAHQQGIIHRDLKPANILLSSDISGEVKDSLGTGCTGTAKITDFGLARRLPSATAGADADTALTAGDAIVGTPAYMAPEQAAGTSGAVGPSTDVYALGSVLYELLTGRPPFQGLSALDILEQVRLREPLPPSRLLPALARDIETICMKCLHKEPVRRYPSAAELADDLGRFLRGEPVRARPTSMGVKTWKWVKRRPALAAALALLVSSIIVGVSTVTFFWRRTAAALELARTERSDKNAARASEVIAQAYRAWLAHDFEQARRRLDQCPPVYRGPEWRYLHRVCHAKLFVCGDVNSARPVTSLAWDPTGRLLASSQLSDAAIWNADTGQLIKVLNHNQRVTQLAFDGDGLLVALCWPPPPLRTGVPAKDYVVQRWHPSDGRKMDSFTNGAGINIGALSPHGRFLIVSRSGSLAVRNIPDGEALTSISDPGSRFSLAAASQDGRMLAWCADSNTIQVWDRNSRSAAGPSLPVAGVRTLTFSPDGNRLAVAYTAPAKNSPGRVDVWDYRAGRIDVELQGHPVAVYSVAFSPDNRCLATGSADSTVKVWDLTTGNELLTLRGHVESVRVVAFSADGTRLATGSADGTVRIWDVRQANTLAADAPRDK